MGKIFRFSGSGQKPLEIFRLIWQYPFAMRAIFHNIPLFKNLMALPNFLLRGGYAPPARAARKSELAENKARRPTGLRAALGRIKKPKNRKKALGGNLSAKPDLKTGCLFFALLCFFAGGAAAAQSPSPPREKICLPLDWKLTSVSGLSRAGLMEMDPTGRYLLYGGDHDRRPVVLFDFETEKEAEFAPALPLVYELYPSEPFYGFVLKSAGAGSARGALMAGEEILAWSLIMEDGLEKIKAQNLTTGETKILTLKEESEKIISFARGFLKSQIIFIKIDRQVFEDFEDREGQGESISFQEIKEKVAAVIVDIADLSIYEEGMDTLSPSKNCGLIKGGKKIEVREDGSIYSRSLKEEEAPLKIFGPVEGLKIPDTPYLLPMQSTVCRFFDYDTVLIKNGGDYIIRKIEERGEWRFAAKDIFSSDPPLIAMTNTMETPKKFTRDILDPPLITMRSFRDRLRFPFLLFPEKGLVFHIPDKKSQPLSALDIKAGKEGKFALVTVYPEAGAPGENQSGEDQPGEDQPGENQSGEDQPGENQPGEDQPGEDQPGENREAPLGNKKNRKIQAVFHPFDPEKRRVAMEWDERAVWRVSSNIEEDLFFVNTVYGDLFVADVENGHISRRFIGLRFDTVQISESGSAFLFQAGSERPYAVGSDFSLLDNDGRDLMAQRFQEVCFDPALSFPGMAPERLLQLAEAEDPSDPALLAALVRAFEDKIFANRHQAAFQKALWNIFLSYPRLYINFHLRYPGAEGFPSFSLSLIESPKDKIKARRSLLSSLDAAALFRHSELSQWDFLRQLQPLMPLLSEREKDFYIEKITESISNGAALAVPLFRDVFQSKLYYIANSHVRGLFGRSGEPVSDITFIRRKNSLAAVILSSHPILGHSSKETDFGVHYAKLEMVDFDKILASFILPMAPSGETEIAIGAAAPQDQSSPEGFEGSAEWRVEGGGRYRVHFAIHPKMDRGLFKNVKLNYKKSPDYAGVWSDHKMTGLVIIGSSLKSFSQELVESYQSYFEEEGFQFESMSVPDFKPFLLEKISNCELDYFLKESHSDGDERNVFRFNSASHVLKGLRRDSRGEREAVYLAFPSPFRMMKTQKTELLSNKELGQAIAARERAGCGEIAYFNTSCWAHVKARYEIEAVNSPLFLNIPSRSVSAAFLNQEGSAIRALIHSYRQGLDFEGFREALRQNKGYLSGKIDNYMFPDERRYYEDIFQHISIPLDIQIDLERKEGAVWRAISPDEAL